MIQVKAKKVPPTLVKGVKKGCSIPPPSKVRESHVVTGTRPHEGVQKEKELHKEEIEA